MAEAITFCRSLVALAVVVDVPFSRLSSSFLRASATKSLESVLCVCEVSSDDEEAEDSFS